ncbi:MAG: dihydropteroate synthase [Candidatus Gastranaerophilales bacterium]|nr:dihydropteroate synthase [Candidatus Gastranaerophilales bacterium]
MKLIGENIHIISKRTKEAIDNRNEEYIIDYVNRMLASNVDYIDLNIGPARKSEGTMIWLASIVRKLTDLPISFDTTNPSEMKAGLKFVQNPDKCIINSISGDEQRMNNLLPLAKEFNSNLIALTLSDATGIPKEADGRLEIAFNILERTAEYEIDNGKIFFDPLVLPIPVAQEQAIETLNSIRMFKESFDPPVLTTIGLSNISNGAPKENRPLINLVFMVLAMGCGLDSAIVDGFDKELIRVHQAVINNTVDNEYDKLYLDLFEMMQNFAELEDVSYDKNSEKQVAIYKTAQVLLNKNIYSHNYL